MTEGESGSLAEREQIDYLANLKKELNSPKEEVWGDKVFEILEAYESKKLDPRYAVKALRLVGANAMKWTDPAGGREMFAVAVSVATKIATDSRNPASKLRI